MGDFNYFPDFGSLGLDSDSDLHSLFADFTKRKVSGKAVSIHT